MIFVFDWDGTLGKSKGPIPKDNEIAIKKLKNMGHEVVIATGRHPGEIISRIWDNKDICKYIIGANGSIIINRDNNEKVFIKNISKEDLKEILIDAKKIRSSIVYIKALHGSKVSRYKNPDKVFKPNEEDEKNLSRSHASIGMEFHNEDKFHETVNYWKEKYKGRLAISISENKFMNFNHASTDKWKAIQWVANKIGKTNSQIITFGDSLNDTNMIKKAHIGIAMGNANKKLIEVADLTIGHYEESGILRFVETLEKNPDMLISKLKNNAI